MGALAEWSKSPWCRRTHFGLLSALWETSKILDGRPRHRSGPTSGAPSSTSLRAVAPTENRGYPHVHRPYYFC